MAAASSNRRWSYMLPIKPMPRVTEGGAKQGCGGHQSDLERREAQREQVNRQEDGDKPIAEITQGPRHQEMLDGA